MGLLDRIHGDFVFRRRVRVLGEALTALIPDGSRVLDVGCGDGALGRSIGERRPDVTLTGIDVLVRPSTHIPVDEFDGRRIPLADRAVDVVMLVDVLHHTDDPKVLLAEGARVARRALLIKDHLADGLFADQTLRFMDRVGNARHGVAMPYNYWPRRRWDEAFASLGLRVAAWREALGLYPFPASLLFDRGLHFIALLDVRSPPDRP